MKKLLLLLALLSTQALSLEIDEVLTLRLLDISSTGKTVLINRGLEDGLVVGDHAKFFVMSGVVARGYVIKTSPTRSIWSIYRVSDSSVIKKDKVLSLKITAPVKVTADPSKAVYEVDQPSVGIEVDQYADDIPKDLTREEQDDLSDLMGDSENNSSKESRSKKSSSKNVGNLNGKTWQVFAIGGYAKNSTEMKDGAVKHSVNTSAMTIGAGVEKYFENTNSIFKNLSLFAFGEMSASTDSDVDEFEAPSFMRGGVGASYHFLHAPLATNAIIPYATISGGLGSVKYKLTPDNELSGDLNFFNIGAGIKYNLDSGLGVRVQASYALQNETYKIEDPGSEDITIDNSGFNVVAGISYSF